MLDRFESPSTQFRLRLRNRFPSLAGTLFACLLLLCSAFGQDFNGKRIRDLTFRSDGPIRRIERSDIEKLVVLEKGQLYTDSKARATITQLLASDLFWDAQIRVEPVDEASIDVQIVLIRMYEISRIRFDGDPELDRHELMRELDFREGEAYSNDGLERSITRLRSLYQRHGFFDPNIDTGFELEKSGRPELIVTFSIEAGQQARVASLDFDMESPPPADELQSRMKTRQGEKFSHLQLDSDLEAVRHRLALDGYFHPEIYLRGGTHYDAQHNTVALDIRVVPREHTDVRWTGLELNETERLELPLYAKAGPHRLLLPETVDSLIERLQDQGYFRAEVRYEITGDEFPPEKVTIHVTAGRKFDLKEIRFEGNRSIADQTLREVLASQKAGIFSRGTFTQGTLRNDTDNIRTIYQHRGHLDATVRHAFEEDGGNLTLVYLIDEGPEYHVGSISLDGNEKLDRAQLLQTMSLKQGEVFSPYLLASDRAQIQAAYESRGYRYAAVESTIEHKAGSLVDVRYAIVEGPQITTRHLLVAGNELTKRKLIDQQILVEPGAPLSYEKLLQSETNLYNLAVFNRVKMKELPVYQRPTEQSALFSLDEAKKYSLIYGVGYSHSFGSTASEGLRGTFGITNTDFQGMARVLALSLRAGSRRQRGNISYTLPRLIGKETPLVLSFSVDNEKRIESNNTASVIIRGRPYDSFRLIGSLQAERALSRRESLFFRYNFERIKLTLPTESTLPPEFFREETNLIFSKVALSYLNDSRDQQENPSRGFFLNGEATLAARPLGSQRQFFKVFTQGRYYFPLYTDLTLVTALRLGAIEPFGAPPASGQSRVPISERFFAGGPSTLRGLPIDLAGPLLTDQDGAVVLVGPEPSPGHDDIRVPVPLGGNALIVGNLELRFPIFRFIGGALFYDVGNVFENFCSIPSSRFEKDVGFGISFKTPVGPVRVDIAYNPTPPEVQGYNRWNVHFNIGNPF